MKFFTTLLLVIVLIGAGYFLWSNLRDNKVESKVALSVPGSNSSAVPNPTPFLFQEMTIPYLRNLKFNSQLGGLEEYTNNGTFTSYLTNYTSDGLKVNGLLTKPAGEMPAGGWPAIVFVHGYIPPPTYRTTEKYVDYINFLARNGFVVFKIDLRGHGSSEGEAGGGYYSSDYVIDTLNAYSALQNSGFVNSGKIGLWGHSMAGNVILRSLAVKPEIPAASIWAGAGFTYTDLRKYGIQDGSYQPPVNQTERQKKRQLLRDRYGEPDGGNPFWKLVAPTDYLADLKGAIQLNHAVDDNVVNIGYSRDLNQVLNNTQIPHELNEYPGGGHNISNPGFTPAMQNTVKFFDQYLK